MICLARTQRANFHQGGSWGIWKESEGHYFRLLAILGWGVPLPRHRSKAIRFHRAFMLKDSKPFEYASYQLERGQLESAAETTEQDEMLIWSEMYGPRTVVGRLPGFAGSESIPVLQTDSESPVSAKLWRSSIPQFLHTEPQDLRYMWDKTITILNLRKYKTCQTLETSWRPYSFAPFRMPLPAGQSL